MFRSTPTTRISQFHFGHPSLKQAFSLLPKRTVPRPPPTETKKTKLENGVTVVSHDLRGPTAVFGFYADAGAKYDPITVPGLSYVMRFAIQTSNMDNSLFQLDRTMRSYGFAYGHGEVRKQHIFWKGEGRRDALVTPFNTMATGIVAPRFHEADIERFRDTMDNLLEEQRFQNPRQYVVDQLESVAYFKEPLGSPRHVWAGSNDKASSSALLNQWATYFNPNRITVSAVNVDHDQLVATYNNLPFPHSASAPHHQRATKALTTGNESLQFYSGKQKVEIENRAKAMGTTPDQPPEVIAAYGWPTAGRDADVKTYAAAAVAFEALNVTLQDGINYDRFDNHSGVRAFYRPYESTGLIGFTARGTPEAAAKDVAATLAKFKALKPANINAAKNRAVIHLYHEELERSSDYADFLATSKASAEDVEKAIKAVTPDAVATALKSLSSVTPSAYVTGNAHAYPSLKQLGY